MTTARWIREARHERVIPRTTPSIAAGHRVARRAAHGAFAACAVGALLGLAQPSRAERLSFRRYDVRDGLAHGRVNDIFQDRGGYLWFSTWEGLSRFDGERFVNYGTDDGLPSPLINTVAEDSLGRLWVACHTGGIARLIDEPRDPLARGADSDSVARSGSAAGARRKFAAFRVGASRESNVVGSILFDGGGTLWCDTGAGLYRARIDSTGVPHFEHVLTLPEEAMGAVMFLDSADRLSLVTATEAIQIRDGAVVRWPRPRPIGYVHGWAALPESDGRWLLSDAQELYHFAPPADSAGSAEWTPLPLRLGPTQDVLVLARDAMGTTWIGTRAGLIAWSGDRVTHYTIAHGLSDDWIRCIFPDRDGNLWIGTHLGGVCRLAPEEIASFTRTEGLASENVVCIRESIDGRIYASTQDAGVYEIGERDVRQVPGTHVPPFDKIWARLHRDRHGRWWFGTIDGFYRAPGPALDLARKRSIGPREGFLGIGAYNNIAEDSTGRIWLGGQDHSVYVFDPDREPLAMHRYTFGDSLSTESPRYFLCTRAGAVWMATYVGVWRLRGDRWVRLEPAEGIPDPDLNTRVLFEDSRGRVWIGLRFSGVSMTDEPDAERPRFVNYSTARGLPSNAVWAIAEDETGRIYLGTGRGVCELDVETGHARVYTTADGLAGDVVNALFRDRRGNVWAGTSGGLSRIDPRMRHASRTRPPVLIARVEAGNETLMIPERGVPRVSGIVLPHSRNNLVVECAGLSFSHAPLSYQWRMDGVDAEWSAPSRDRTLRYAGLAPGAYTLHVRAVTPDGLASAEPAEVELRVLPPIWMRWWFLALCAAAIAAAALAWHRARIRRIFAMERIRRQIATDLHDDIGSGLSQIAILSEVAKRDAAAEPALVGRLDELAELARAMREGMSDIVWAIDPRKDRLVDLVRRMQQVAFGLLASNGRVVEFNAPSEDAMRRLALAPDRKRHLFLAFKETVANVARHSGAGRARVDVSIGERALTLVIEDDGAGFDPEAAHEGHGLASLRSRASALGARLAIDSSPGRGTRVELVVPLGRGGG